VVRKRRLNSRYFHSILKWKRAKNEIKGVNILGKWCEEPNAVKGEIKDYFRKRLTEETHNDIRLDNNEFPTLTLDDNNTLTCNIIEEEIKIVVW